MFDYGLTDALSYIYIYIYKKLSFQSADSKQFTCVPAVVLRRITQNKNKKYYEEKHFDFVKKLVCFSFIDFLNKNPFFRERLKIYKYLWNKIDSCQFSYHVYMYVWISIYLSVPVSFTTLT